MQKNSNDNLPQYQKSLICFPGFLLILGVFFAVLAVVIPDSGICIDVLLAFSFCLTIVIPLVITGAKQPAELASFPRILFATTLTRTALAALFLKTIITNGNQGRILNLFSNFFPERFLTIAIISLACAAIISIITIIISAIYSIKKAKQAAITLIPAKIKGVKNDLTNGILDEKESTKLYNRINLERAYYDGISSTSTIIFLEIWILTAIIGCAAIYLAPKDATISFAPKLTNTIVGSFILYILALLTATANAKIVSKGSFKLKEFGEKQSSDKTGDFEKALNMAEKKEFELINPNFKDVTRLLEKSDENREFATTFSAPTENQGAKAKDDDYQNSDEFYDDIALKINELILDDIERFALFAQQDSPVPVTVPVNIAIRLSQQNWRVLLVDAEKERNAICDVFEINAKDAISEPTQTFISDVSVIRNCGENFDEKIEKDDFDAIITYASWASLEKIGKLCINNDAVIGITCNKEFMIKTEAVAISNNCETTLFYKMPTSQS